jgi:hypothetical protein
LLPVEARQGMQLYLTFLVALTVLLGVAHETTVVTACCNSISLVRQLSRRALAANTAPARRRRAALTVPAPAPPGDMVAEGRHSDLQAVLKTAQGAELRAWGWANCAHQCALVRVWHLAATAGNLCLVSYVILMAVEFKIAHLATVVPSADQTFDSPGHTKAPRLLLGCGAGLLWLSLMQYLEHFPKYYAFVLTLKRAMPRLTRVSTTTK